MANLVELFDNIVQMQALNGVPLANGKLYVYALGRTRLMDTWSDVDGESLNTNPIILDDAGQAHVYVSDDFDYTLVVCDAYNNEVFSIDKYLYSKGEHSHADVAVAPSEHIGVSSYHVGETTVYVPYIQGELGKTYHGIEPIVVNNQENKISARNIPLGVQEPLYFVEDSESACVIGMSGEYQPITGMSGYATTSDLADMAESISETYQPKGDYATVDDLSGFMEESKLETADGKITAYNGTAFAGGGSVDPSEFIPWSASGNFATSGDLNDKLDTTAFSTVSGDFITAVPDTYATKDFVSSSVSSKLDSTAFADVSGNFITALPEGLLNESGFEYDGDKISAYNGSAFVGQGGGGITGEYELSPGNGISIDNYPVEQKTVISVSGDYLTKDSADTIYQPIGDYLSSNALEGYATENWVTSQGYITTETDWSDTITAASANAYNEATAAIPTGLATTGDLANVSADITAQIPTDLFTKASADTLYQPIGNYLTTGDSANFYTTANESGFITGVDLTPYQLTADMTAYQPAGDYLTTADSANFYTTANESGYLTEVPDTYLQNTDLSTTDGKVTAISGIPLSAGGDVPEGVMVESGLEYNAVNEISAYNGSAIAQYGAEKQWLVHDDTLTHISNSAQYALGVAIDNVARLLGVDETELLSSTANSAFTLTEPFSSFKQVKIKLRWWDKVPDNYYSVERFTNNKCSLSWTYFDNVSDANPLELVGASWTSNNGLYYNLEAGYAKVFSTASTAIGNFTHTPYPLSIVGVGRKS